MRLPLTRLENIALTIITNPLTISPVCLLFLVRLGGYIVNLCAIYSYRLIRKLTSFLQFQEFSLHNQTVDRVTFSSHLKSKIGNILTKASEVQLFV